jgi:hypothetical protein
MVLEKAVGMSLVMNMNVMTKYMMVSMALGICFEMDMTEYMMLKGMSFEMNMNVLTKYMMVSMAVGICFEMGRVEMMMQVRVAVSLVLSMMLGMSLALNMMETLGAVLRWMTLGERMTLMKWWKKRCMTWRLR